MILTRGLLEKASSGSQVDVTLLYPRTPPGTYWGFEEALGFVGKKAALPPLGLITIAGLLPDNYRPTLVDTNIEPLSDERIGNSDLFLLSGMTVQFKSMRELIKRISEEGKTILFGGPTATKYFEVSQGILDDMKDRVVWVLNEGENTLPLVMNDLAQGSLKPLYARPPTRESLERIVSRSGFSDVDAQVQDFSRRINPPSARFDLVNMDAYDSMIVQFSRGCPGGCEFCDVSTLFGGRTRFREPEDVVAELQALYDLGWHGGLFIADDNTIGNRRLAEKVLDAVGDFQERHGNPFNLNTEMDISIANNPELLEKYVRAGGKTAFFGIETPNPASLEETGKIFNLSKEVDPEKKIAELVQRIRTIQQHIEVTGGFIIGFDSDDERVFGWQEQLIKEAGIPVAMVGLLSAVPGTPLYERLESEGRLISDFDGNNTHADRTNFVTTMDADVLAREYTGLLRRLYGKNLKSYYERALTMFENQKGRPAESIRGVTANELKAGVRAIKLLFKPSGLNLLNFYARTIMHYPDRFPDAVRLAIFGNHFAEITNTSYCRHDLAEHVREQYHKLKENIGRRLPSFDSSIGHIEFSLDDMKAALVERMHAYVNKKPRDYKRRVQEYLQDLSSKIEEMKGLPKKMPI
ncbi:B12-binding domain-containing radical SAM protein [Candidatus Woesearchaeota archaeon]|nr:B12-binding domain-containing radical SAM protein [Candidatus Woesearchaeota archaeon]